MGVSKRAIAVLICQLVGAGMTGVSAAEISWQTVGQDRNRQVQLDRSSIRPSEDGSRIAWVRIVLPGRDAESEGFAAIKALNRFDCTSRSITTVKRVYVDEQQNVVREEAIAQPLPVFITRNSVDERLWREVCRPPSADELRRIAGQANSLVATSVAPVAGDGPSAESSNPVAAPARANRANSAGRSPAPVVRTGQGWQFDGPRGPQAWGKLQRDWAVCSTGRRQSPIDLQANHDEALTPLQFDYKATTYRVVNTGRYLRVDVPEGMGVNVRGQRYALTRVQIHHPVYEQVDGLRAEAAFHLHHRAPSGQRLIVAILLQAQGGEHPVLQAILNSAQQPGRGSQDMTTETIDWSALVPFLPAYYLYEGSLVTPPCTEGVLWVVMRQPGIMSAAQQTLLQMLHPVAGRPVQPENGRKIFRTY